MYFKDKSSNKFCLVNMPYQNREELDNHKARSIPLLIPYCMFNLLGIYHEQLIYSGKNISV